MPDGGFIKVQPKLFCYSLLSKFTSQHSHVNLTRFNNSIVLLVCILIQLVLICVHSCLRADFHLFVQIFAFFFFFDIIPHLLYVSMSTSLVLLVRPCHMAGIILIVSLDRDTASSVFYFSPKVKIHPSHSGGLIYSDGLTCLSILHLCIVF